MEWQNKFEVYEHFHELETSEYQLHVVTDGVFKITKKLKMATRVAIFMMVKQTFLKIFLKQVASGQSTSSQPTMRAGRR